MEGCKTCVLHHVLPCGFVVCFKALFAATISLLLTWVDHQTVWNATWFRTNPNTQLGCQQNSRG